MKKITLALEPHGMRLEVSEGASYLSAIRESGRFIQADCGGHGTCGKCRIVIQPAPSPGERDTDHLTPQEISQGIRLSCQHSVEDNSRAILPSETSEAKILTESVVSEQELARDQEEGYGIAIDIGTTTVVCYFFDLMSGTQIGSESILNPQIAYGEDVVSRLTYAIREPLGKTELQSKLWAKIEGMIERFLNTQGIALSDIHRISVVGNTAMHHLSLGLEVESLALSPYTPTLRKAYNTIGKEVGMSALQNTQMYFAPNIAGYVGGDALGFVLSRRIHENSSLTFGIDVGTNSEIVAVKNRKLLCCSAAAGPAFEGARITQGMRARTGAIEYVRIESIDEAPEISVIGNASPVGLCGSAILDLVAELRRIGLVDITGKLREGRRVIEMSSHGRSYLVRGPEDSQIRKSIFITQRDIRQVQLAKAAIRAGTEILASRTNSTPEQVETFYLAGAFGNYLRPESALEIGLLPPVDLSCIRPVGNAAGEGAKLVLLSKEEREEMNRIADSADYIELATAPEFKDLFYRATVLSPELGNL